MEFRTGCQIQVPRFPLQLSDSGQDLDSPEVSITTVKWGGNSSSLTGLVMRMLTTYVPAGHVEVRNELALGSVRKGAVGVVTACGLRQGLVVWLSYL